MMRVGIDLMGGDYAPAECISGVKHFLSSLSQEETHKKEIVLLGESDAVLPLLEQQGLQDAPAAKFVATGESVNFADSSTKIFKEKPNSSLCRGFSLLGTGEIDAFISAGHTGGMLVGAHTIVKPCENVIRPCIGAMIPRRSAKNPCILLDVGSNLECKPEQLNQMAVLGAVYLETLYSASEKMKVALLNVGEEPNKGGTNYVEAYKLLSQNSKIDFIGNIEGRDILTTSANVIVCDGFVGNIILKLMESLYDNLNFKEEVGRSDDSFLRQFNFEEYGGIPILGVTKPVIVGHGISKSQSFERMLRLAFNLLELDFCGKMEKELRL